MIDNLPAENEWYLQDDDTKSLKYGKKFKFCFDQYEVENLRILIKSYVWQNHQAGTIALRTIYTTYKVFKRIYLFAVENGIDRLSDFNADDADSFMTYLKVSNSTYTGKPASYSHQAGIFAVLKSIIYWGQIFAPELVPSKEIFVGNEYPYVNKGDKIEYIPDNVLKQINAALLTEENPYIKYGFIIFLSTGMRLCELLNLEIGCVSPHLLNGDTLSFYDFKRRRQHRKLPINPVCAAAISALTEITAEVRKKADVHTKKICSFMK
jgi:integrase